MTNRDYPGTIYYTIRNVSLYECLGWCRDEVDCTAAAFSFVVNPLTPIQETTCLLQNETLSKKTNAVASGSYSSTSLQKAVNMYFFSKMQLRTGEYRAGPAMAPFSQTLTSLTLSRLFLLPCPDNLCNRLWSFERFPNKILRGLDNAIIFTANKEACLSACLNEVRVCTGRRIDRPCALSLSLSRTAANCSFGDNPIRFASSAVRWNSIT